MIALDSSRSKLVRAARHSNTVRAAMQQFIEHDLPTATVGPQVSWTQEWQTLRWDSVPTVPAWVAATFGDFLTNARAGLDHAIYAMVVANGWKGSPDHTMCPVTESESAWEEATAAPEPGKKPARGWGLATAALALVRSQQPFVTHPDDPAGAPLARLRRASNRDKHRVLFAAGIVPTMPAYLTFNPPGYIELVASEPAAPGTRIRSGSAFGRIRLRIAENHPDNMTVDQSAGFDWGMFRDEDTDEPLILSHHLREVLATIEQFLDAAEQLPDAH